MIQGLLELLRADALLLQEEFADAFDDGYHFEVVGGATVACPVRR